MGHHEKKGRKLTEREIEEKFHWPWELSIDIGTLQPPKVAFLSGQERQYFPENPGYSRHGVEYSMNCHPGDVPNPNYYPSEDKLQKPVSLLGYGIGGLLAPRFAKDPHDKSTLVKAKDNDDDDEGNDQIHRFSGPQKSDAALAQKRASALKNQQHQKKCSLLSFGTMKDIPRFGLSPRWTCVGVGNYDLGTPNLCKKMGLLTSFGRGPVKLIPPTVMECSYENLPHCSECGNPQRARDYYKSVKTFSLPKIRYFLTDSETHPPPPTKEGGGPPASAASHMLKPQIICMCRKCFCRVMREGHSFWKKTDLATKFQKTRHCVNIHQHNDLPVFTHKVSCKLVRDLARKEALMARYFDDSCAKVIKEITTATQSNRKAQWGKPVPV